jgi:hypothetical protein
MKLPLKNQVHQLLYFVSRMHSNLHRLRASGISIFFRGLHPGPPGDGKGANEGEVNKGGKERKGEGEGGERKMPKA